MRRMNKVIVLLFIGALIFMMSGCKFQDNANKSAQAAGDNPSVPIQSEDQFNHNKNELIKFEFAVLSEQSTQDSLEITEDCVYYSWLDFVTPEQLEIVRNYLEMPEGTFNDNTLVSYAYTMDRELLRRLDAIPMEDMPEDADRIIVRMYEGYWLMNLEVRKNASLELGMDEPDYTVSEFGRAITDWR